MTTAARASADVGLIVAGHGDTRPPPANLLQAQRDYFGAHTYERVDAPGGKIVHVDWPDPKRPLRPV